jgi:hypothetical protein
MPVRHRSSDDWHDAWGDDGDADDGFDEYDDVDDEDDEPTIPCPYCRREIHEDAERCPHCERYIADEDAPPERKPLWIIVGSLACFYIFYRWILG